MKEVSRLLPNEDLIYLGDTANLPYGNKSPQTVLQFSLENARFLLQKNIKLLVIACHTASSHALEVIQSQMPIPVIGVVIPGLELIKTYKRIAILATTSTIESGIYQSLIRKQNPKAQIFPVACPLFVPLIEEGFADHPSALLIAEKYLSPLKGTIDAALLACTHYPLMRATIQKALGDNVILIEPARQCALQVHKYLSARALFNDQTTEPRYEFYASDDPEKFRKFGEMFLSSTIERVEKK